MICKNCGNEIGDGDKFCMECGTPVEAVEEAVVSEVAIEPDAETEAIEPVSDEAEAEPALPETAPLPVMTPEESAPVTPAVTAPASSTESADPAQTAPANPKRNLIIIGAVVLVAVIAVIVACVFAFGGASDEQPAPDDAAIDETAEATGVVMPDLKGMDSDSAHAVLMALNVDFTWEYKPGAYMMVVDQQPKAGEEIMTDEEVIVYLGEDQPASTNTSSASTSANGTHTVPLTVVNPRNGQSVTSQITLDANDDVIPNLLTREYTREEIEAMGLSDAELYIARNSIVAKTGYIFHYQPNTQFFIDNAAWYVPENTEYQLSGIGGANAMTIRDIELDNDSWYLEIK